MINSNKSILGMRVYCLYYKDEFVVCYKNRQDCVEYGKKHYEGMEWDCSILVKYLHDAAFYTSTSPIVPHSQPFTTPYTPPIPLKTTPYEPNIWCESKTPNATYSVDYSQTPKINENQ